jgi:predicted double-glycine peptidase
MTTRSWPWSGVVGAALAGMAILTGAGLPAEAGSLYIDIGVGGGAMSFKVESFQEQKYRNTIAQEHDFSCGSAALATLLSHNYNIKVSETDVFKDMIVNGDKKTISESGFSLLDIKRYLQRRGLDSNGFRAPLSKLEEVRLPAIVLLNVRGYRHFVVLEGIQNGRALLADPANGMRSEPIGVFEAEWSGIFFLITSDVAQGQKNFNSDQKWAAAPGPPWGLTRYAIDLATALPLAQPGLLNLSRF